MDKTDRPTIAVHKFTSCDGCQLAFLNAGERLLDLSDLVEIVHFAEAGQLAPEVPVEIAFVEGSVSTPEEITRIKKIRAHSHYLITIGACATAGGIQALRNAANHQNWMAGIYAAPELIRTLDTSTAIANHVRVDWELWGCPVSTDQIMDAIRSLLYRAAPEIKRDSVCMECKRQGHVCVLVTKKEPCLGPVTQTGCGAICPGFHRACYACYGPAENPNPNALGARFQTDGLSNEVITRLFLHINSQSPAFLEAGDHFKGIKIVKE